MNESAIPRSRLRLRNFSSAMDGLREAIELRAQRPLSELEKAGMVQRFELAWELGWKLLSDLLTEDLAPPEALTPGSTIRAAFAAGLIADADEWMAMGKLRNQLSHTYNRAMRDEGLVLIEVRFAACLAALEQDGHRRGA
ncbi:MAG TPA: HI0074 family nucleotidyltransferase substrate-binding subunit [Chakrabartia sp.]|nr:HI0074 family nucleotidyltransferase substrate-binding subunit [Chakrabartia sp.]